MCCCLGTLPQNQDDVSVVHRDPVCDVTYYRYPCTPGASLPGAPYHVDIAPSNGSVTVTWEPPEKDSGAPVQLCFVNVSQVESSATSTLFFELHRWLACVYIVPREHLYPYT